MNSIRHTWMNAIPIIPIVYLDKTVARTVSGKLVTFSHQIGILTNVPELPNVDEEPFKVTLNPNPVRDRLTITTDYEKGRTGVHIINAQGIDVRRFSMQGTATIDVSDLPAGVYTVQILGGKMVTRKFIKN